MFGAGATSFAFGYFGLRTNETLKHVRIFIIQHFHILRAKVAMSFYYVCSGRSVHKLISNIKSQISKIKLKWYIF